MPLLPQSHNLPDIIPLKTPLKGERSKRPHWPTDLWVLMILSSHPEPTLLFVCKQGDSFGDPWTCSILLQGQFYCSATKYLAFKETHPQILDVGNSSFTNHVSWVRSSAKPFSFPFLNLSFPSARAWQKLSRCIKGLIRNHWSCRRDSFIAF